MKRIWPAFWLGILAQSGCDIWYQDSLGKEGYIAQVDAHWVTLSPWFGFGLLALALGALAVLYLASLIEGEKA